jgi:carbamoyl-phosphate synthase large subunit
VRRRDKVVSGESQVTTTWRDTEIEAQSEEILGRLRLSGPVVMQAILSPNDSMQVIECNARFGGASTASIAVGLDLLYWSILERREPGLPLPQFSRRAGEIRQIRVPHDIVLDDTDI